MEEQLKLKIKLKLNNGVRPPLFSNSFIIFLFFILFNSPTAFCVSRNNTLFGLYLTKSKTASSSSSVSTPPKQNPKLPSPSKSQQTFSVKPNPNQPTTTTDNDDAKSNDYIFSRSSSMPIPTQPPTTTPPEIKKICDNTDYPSLCVASLTPFLSGRGKAEPISLLGLAIKATTVHAKKALAMASKLAAAPGASKGDVMSLESCKEIYDDAISNLENANEAVGSRDIGTVNSMMSAVVTDSENCEDSFDGDSPLFKYDDKLRKMASNCLAIASLIN
ncbi:hypothetical protein G4B88_028690 [Cannabis sativa]|uniref:Pectinesterase inhibitor domain-containing protein n=1 Tax=Cannabis sativa TaxID=3483 RepID=A0A7J6EQF4_CANSA|nr:hypothetical protein G4B88_028690 [Cannabis sativa]